MDKRTLVTGFSRIGENRELKIALENYWAQKIPLPELLSIAKNLRKKHWLEQKERGIDLISSNDFSLYDLMLDTTVMLNAVPDRFKEIQDDTERYFAMARGCKNCTAMEMTKWFNTNYHYIVPELNSKIDFKLNANKVISEYNEAKKLGINTKINLIGPITYLSLAKSENGDNGLDYIDNILPVYAQLMDQISQLDNQVYVQLDEPIFVNNPSKECLSLIGKV
ncbi:MAG TPA: 5-methyltetrahydropteroyltriglutamate--homocysteine S-methyltransferase, partial [Spirochaetota bacterium]|nr:5-methyltetrahydropteroyltriglutamate--homocysteine S-methyltransferase [Spirochaetota bacterium]